MALDKSMTAEAVVGQLRDGMTLGIGGWGPRRKPMALVRELLRSDLRELTVVSYGGPEVGMLCAAGKVARLVYPFVTMDAMPLEPHFRRARQSGAIAVLELDEGMFEWGLRAAGMGLSFLPTRCGLGTDVLTRNPELKTVSSPYDDGEVYVAMPALKLDAALLHVNAADRLGNTLSHGHDVFFDHLFARAAKACYVSSERMEERFALDADAAQANRFERYLVRGVVHAPCGAHPTYLGPDYGWDLKHLKTYAASAESDDGWQQYLQDFVLPGEAAYLDRVGGEAAVRALPLPVF